MSARIVCLALLSLGLGTSAYLFLRQRALASEAASPTDVCSAVFGSSCDETLAGPWAVELGLPLAGWGIVYYGTQLALVLLGWALGESFNIEALVAAWALALAGGAVSLGLVALLLTGTAPICPLCLVIHATNLILLPALRRYAGRSWGELFRLLGSSVALLVRRDPLPQAARAKAVALLAVGLVAVVLYQWAYIEAALPGRDAAGRFDPREVLAAYQAAPLMEVPLGDEDPRLGPADAPARLVVFSDFQCPGCRAFARRLPALARRYDGRLQVVFKHLPLGTACNDSINRDLHPQACELAWAADAARRQGRFWAFHDALFASVADNGLSDSAAAARETGLDMERFEVDRHDVATRDKVRSDIAAGLRLGVDVTPAIFLNGRRVHDIRPQALAVIVGHLIEQNDGQRPRPTR